jgi:hypothetical protein
MRSLLQAAILVALLGMPARAGTPPALKLTVYPRFALAHANARITLRVQKHPDNRTIVLLWDGPISGSDERPHVGEAAPAQIVYDHALINMPDGIYVIQAVLVRVDPQGNRSELRSLVETIQIGGDPDGGA